jgi:hypothetical protein
MYTMLNTLIDSGSGFTAGKHLPQILMEGVKKILFLPGFTDLEKTGQIVMDHQFASGQCFKIQNIRLQLIHKKCPFLLIKTIYINKKAIQVIAKERIHDIIKTLE